jgi:hypothetical protein
MYILRPRVIYSIPRSQASCSDEVMSAPYRDPLTAFPGHRLLFSIPEPCEFFLSHARGSELAALIIILLHLVAIVTIATSIVVSRAITSATGSIADGKNPV